jgi:hypothetical protein
VFSKPSKHQHFRYSSSIRSSKSLIFCVFYVHKHAQTRSQTIAQRFQQCYNERMSMPPTYLLNQLGPQAQRMSNNCGNERMAMVLQSVAIGCMIIMAGAAASQVLRDAFGPTDHHRGRSRSR